MKRWIAALVGTGVIVAACTKRDATSPPAPGSLSISVNGLEEGVQAAITVTGPANYEAVVTGSDVLEDLTPGTYEVRAGPVNNDGGDQFASDQVDQQVEVAENTSVPISIVYTLATGRLDITVTGLPDGSFPSLRLDGPDAFTRQITSAGVQTGLFPGAYVVTPQDVSAEDAIYGAEPSGTLTIAASATASSIGVTYALASGDLALDVSGPTGSETPTLTIDGPNGFTTTAAPGDTLRGIRAGAYTITGDTLSGGDHVYAPAGSADADVEVGAETSVVLGYEQVTGSLEVTVAGLPPAADANITVTGPGGYTERVTQSVTLHGLQPGTYTIDADNVAEQGDAYEPTPATQTEDVAAAGTGNAVVAYTNTGPIGFNLTIDGMYVVQSIQRYDGTVPLVAGRAGYLRVFGMANGANIETPPIRVWWYDGANVIDSATISAPGASVPTSPNEGQLASSWNIPLPAGVITPTLRLRALIDPGNDVAEADETDNAFPEGGQPVPVDVRSQPPLPIRFVPVYQTESGDTGRVNVGNIDSFLDQMERMFPIASIDADLRSTYTSSGDSLQSNNGNDAWNRVLSEVLTLRTMDGSDRYYYGVVRVSYGSGVAGIGYRPGEAALGWDYLPSGSGVMAHELGHNLSRRHAPCGGPSGVDGAYPYNNASIGVWGMDVSTTTLKSPSQQKDLMSYCGPEWISDYTYEGIMDYHAAIAADAYVYQSGSQPGLLVWGRITDSGIVLEPAFAVTAVPSLPSNTGPYRVESIDTQGRTIFSAAFEGEEVADLPSGSERHFSFVIPWSGQNPGALRVRGGGFDVVRQASRTTGRNAAIVGADDRRALIEWDAGQYPMALVRDAATGEILSFARGGSARIATRARTLHVTLSDGVQSVAVGTVRAR